MATDEVYMDIPAVQKMADAFDTFGDVLDGVATAMQAIAHTLKATAFLSLGMSYAAGQYFDRLAPKVKQAAAKMRELKRDIYSAIAAYRDGDRSGSQRFIS